MQALMYQIKCLAPELNFTRIQQRYLWCERIINLQSFASARNSIVQVVCERNDEGIRDFNIGGIANLRFKFGGNGKNLRRDLGERPTEPFGGNIMFGDERLLDLTRIDQIALAFTKVSPRPITTASCP